VFFRDRIVFGAICGLASAVGYTGANICLRAVSDCDPIWVSCVKSIPTIALIGPWLFVLAHRGVRILPSAQVFWALVLAGALGQFGGNVMFQWSLGIIGIALAVPICLGSIIVSGAFTGRIFLGETVTRRSAIAVAILIAAIFILSVGAGDAYDSVSNGAASPEGSLPYFNICAGIAAAAFSGFAYAVLGVVIKYGVNEKTPASTTMVIIAMIGVIGLGAGSWMRIGLEQMLATTSTDLGVMTLAGLFNAMAFLALTRALQLTPVTFVNALNASQVAMAAIAGVLIFHEEPSIPMVVGVMLTVVGLLQMRRRRVAEAETQEKEDRATALSA